MVLAWKKDDAANGRNPLKLGHKQLRNTHWLKCKERLYGFVAFPTRTDREFKHLPNARIFACSLKVLNTFSGELRSLMQVFATLPFALGILVAANKVRETVL